MGGAVITVMEYIGTAAFAVSGAATAVRRGLDLFGVTLVGCVTAVSGGILRDVISGKTPPAIFSNLPLLCVAAVSSLAVFILLYIFSSKLDLLEERIERINLVFDALGLSAFSVIGTEAAFSRGLQDKAVLAVFMGVITGIGGGMVRDVLVSEIPYVLKKHIYALASLTGSAAYYIIRAGFGRLAALTVALPLTVIIRLLAAKYRWKLPKVRPAGSAKE